MRTKNRANSHYGINLIKRIEILMQFKLFSRHQKYTMHKL